METNSIQSISSLGPIRTKTLYVCNLYRLIARGLDYTSGQIEIWQNNQLSNPAQYIVPDQVRIYIAINTSTLEECPFYTDLLYVKYRVSSTRTGVRGYIRDSNIIYSKDKYV